MTDYVSRSAAIRAARAVLGATAMDLVHFQVKTVPASDGVGERFAWEPLDNTAHIKEPAMFGKKDKPQPTIADALGPVAKDEIKEVATKAPKAAKGKAEKTAKAPTEKKRSRVHVTLEALAHPHGVTVEELAAKFEAEFGDGKKSTATMAINKVPKSAGISTTREKVEGRGSVYRSVAA